MSSPLASRLPEALRKGEIRSHFQPIFDTDGRLRSVEALARWKQPDGSSVPPSIFIPLLEREGLVSRFDERILDCVKDLLDNPLFPSDVRVYMNTTERQVSKVSYSRRFLHRATAAGIDHDRVGLDVKGAVAADDPLQLGAHVRRLRNAGTSVAIDDFGASSPMNVLFDLPIDVVKFDRSLISQVDANPVRSNLTSGLIRTVGESGFELVAEGVERVEEQDWLVGAGIDYLQGYLLAEPQSASDLLAQLEPSPSAHERNRPSTLPQHC